MNQALEELKQGATSGSSTTTVTPSSDLQDPLESSTLESTTLETSPPKAEAPATSTEPGLRFSKLHKRVAGKSKASDKLLGFTDEAITEGTPIGAEDGPTQINTNVAREQNLASRFSNFGLDLKSEADKKLPKRKAQLGRDEKYKQNAKERFSAIDDSGIVPKHAESLSNVAALRGEIIMTRPVNKDCTKLIEHHAATKHLHIKSKSTDWGPAAGYIPRDGRYSKLGNPEIQGKLNTKGMKDSSDKAEIAIEQGWAVPLTMVSDGGKPVARDPKSVGESDLVWGIPEASGDETWSDLKAVKEPVLTRVSELGKLKPLQVLGDPASGQPIAADYDLFAIAARSDKVKKNKDEYKFDVHMGVITDRQKGSLMDVNAAVMGAGHKGGRVAHHGTETQNPYTELDFPLTSFEPDGSVVSVKSQVELVDYFNRMVQAGYDLSPNDKWLTDPPDGGSGLWKWSKWSGSPGNWHIAKEDLHPVKGES